MRRLAGLATVCALLVGVAHEPIAGRASTDATPYLQLTGTIPIAGQATVASGDTATAYGSGFCGAPGCSAVTLTIGDRIAARAVQVSTDGTFRAAFVVTEDPGRYTVTASQQGSGGATLEDSATLIVAIGDVEENEGPPAVALKVLNAQDGVFLASMHPKTCCARRIAYFQRRTSTGRWRTIKRFVFDRNSARRFTASLPRGNSSVRVQVPRTTRLRAVTSRALLVRR